MMKTILRVLICALLICGVAAPSFAKAKKKATPPPAHETVISSVTANSITVTDEKTSKTVNVSPLTEVIVNGQKAAFADLKPGMTVSLVLSGPTQASRITANSK
jgi:hypothetical protein